MTRGGGKKINCLIETSISFRETIANLHRTCSNKSKIAKRFVSIIIEMCQATMFGMIFHTRAVFVFTDPIKNSPASAVERGKTWNILRCFLWIVKVIFNKNILIRELSFYGLKNEKSTKPFPLFPRSSSISYLLSFYDFKCESQ